MRKLLYLIAVSLSVPGISQAAATSYIQSRTSFQGTGTTAFIDSATVRTELNIGNGTGYSQKASQALTGNGGINWTFYTNPAPTSSPYLNLRLSNQITAGNPGGFGFEDGTFHRFVTIDPGTPALILHSTTSLQFYDADNSNYIALKASNTVAANKTFVLPAADGTSGQAIITDGAGTLSFGSVSGSGGSLLSTQTWAGQNNWTTPGQSTFTYGVTMGSLTVNGSGNGEIDLVKSDGISKVVSSSVSWTAGQCAIGSSSQTVIWGACGSFSIPVDVSTTVASGNLLRLTNTSGAGNPFLVDYNHQVMSPRYQIYNAAAYLGIATNQIVLTNTNASGGDIVLTAPIGSSVTVPTGGVVVTYGVTVGSLTVSGSTAGAGQLTEGADSGAFASSVGMDNYWASSSSHAIVATFNGSASTYTIVSSSVTPVAGQYGIWTSAGPNAWTLGSGSGGGTPGGSTGQIQWNNAGSFAGSTNTVVTASSITFISSVTLNTGGGAPADNVTPGQLNVFSGAGSYVGKILLNTGSQGQRDQFYIADRTPAYMGLYGGQIGGLHIGYEATPQQIVSQSRNNYFEVNLASTMTFQTDSDIGGGDILFNPQASEALRVSKVSGITQTVASAIPAYILKQTTTTTAGLYSFASSTNSHFSSGGIVASTSSCGTGAGFTGTDFNGFITPGAGASGCIVTFAKPYKNLPVCVVSERTMSLVNALSYTVTKAALSISQTSFSSIVDYICTGLQE